MAFEATKREWCELYTFFRLLTEGKVTVSYTHLTLPTILRV